MQTFLPYEDFGLSARSLDYRRLGKQRVEVLQIHNAMHASAGGWRNHPAVNMWRGHEWWLMLYGIEMCVEWRRRGYNDNLLIRFLDTIESLSDDGYPPWLGLSELHASHRGNLIRKDPVFYRSLGWTEEPMMGYHWPVR